MFYPFLSSVVGLTSAKLWHDTLRIFIHSFVPDYTREILEEYSNWNLMGVMIGGILAGFLTDSMTPNRTFPTSIGSISILSLLLILTYKVHPLNELLEYIRIGLCFLLFFMIIQGKSKASRRLAFLASICIISMTLSRLNIRFTLVFFRGISIAVAMNSAYVSVGDMFKGSPFLPKASTYLYLSLFGSLAIYPLLFEYLPKQTSFITAAVLMGVLAILLKRAIPKTKSSAPSFRRYLGSWPILASKPEFLLTCGVSMVCIGGFYNIMYILTDASLHKEYFGNVSSLQSIGRWVTFGTLVVFNTRALQSSGRNCSQYMGAAMGLVAISSAILLSCRARPNGFSTGFIPELCFLVSCLATGFGQPAAKTGVISIAQYYGRSITGSAQSFVTLLNSALEYGGCKLILLCTYPFGAKLYLDIIIWITGLLAIGLFFYRNQINKTIAK